jgi:hypothetical protein
MKEDIRALVHNLADVPDWEKGVEGDIEDGEDVIDIDDSDVDPADAISHQMLIEIGAITGLREVLRDRVSELLAKHDDMQDLIVDLDFVRNEVSGDLQRVLLGTDLGKECQANELEWPLSVNALRKKKEK